ncbi:unnamed protein product [Closterium sp. Naga37s-1]|nr:unnamed protein product [Closterium sp. Naga37s-1]
MSQDQLPPQGVTLSCERLGSQEGSDAGGAAAACSYHRTPLPSMCVALPFPPPNPNQGVRHSCKRPNAGGAGSALGPPASGSAAKKGPTLVVPQQRAHTITTPCLPCRSGARTPSHSSPANSSAAKKAGPTLVVPQQRAHTITKERLAIVQSMDGWAGSTPLWGEAGNRAVTPWMALSLPTLVSPSLLPRVCFHHTTGVNGSASSKKAGPTVVVPQQRTHTITKERLAVVQSMDGWAESTLLPLLKPVEASWQPQDYLPYPKQEYFLDELADLQARAATLPDDYPDYLPHPEQDSFLDQLAEIQARAATLPDDYLVCLVGDIITSEALPTYHTLLSSTLSTDPRTRPAPAPARARLLSPPTSLSPPLVPRLPLPQDYLPHPEQDSFIEKLADLQARAATLPDDYLVYP